MTAPRRIEWAGPEGWTVWADEDGVHVRTPKGDGLEHPDLQNLVDLVDHVNGLMDEGQIPAPRPLTPEERRDLPYPWREQYAAKRAIRAVQREFTDDVGGQF